MGTATSTREERERLQTIAGSCACTHLRQASRAITQRYDEELRPTGLRATQFTLLVGIRLSEPVALSDLADGLVIDRTTLSRNLALLEQRGLVTRRPGEDGRVRQLATTERGRKALDEAYPRWRAAQGAVEAGIGSANLERLFRTLGEAVDLSRGSP